MIQPMSTKQTTTSYLKSLNTKMTMTYAEVNPDPDLRQACKCDRVKPVHTITIQI